jgi:hypothetical protein
MDAKGEDRDEDEKEEGDEEEDSEAVRLAARWDVRVSNARWD